eukprot:30083-Chlamydomonas_euryale.AAC.2
MPTGTRVLVDYSRDPPTASVRIQVCSCMHAHWFCEGGSEDGVWAGCGVRAGVKGGRLSVNA